MPDILNIKKIFLDSYISSYSMCELLISCGNFILHSFLETLLWQFLIWLQIYLFYIWYDDIWWCIVYNDRCTFSPIASIALSYSPRIISQLAFMAFSFIATCRKNIFYILDVLTKLHRFFSSANIMSRDIGRLNVAVS